MHGIAYCLYLQALGDFLLLIKGSLVGLLMTAFKLSNAVFVGNLLAILDSIFKSPLMKTGRLNNLCFIFLLLVLSGGAVNAQKGHDPITYSAEGKRMLTRAVDSLNAAQPADPAVKRAFPQAKARYVSISGPRALEAATMLATEPTWDAFLAAFPQDPAPHPVLVAKFPRFQGSQMQQNYLESIVFPGEWSHQVAISTDAERRMPYLAGKWVFQFVPDKDSARQKTNAFYFMSDLQNPALPLQYAALLQSLDLLVDAKDSVYLPEAKNGHPEYDLDSLPYWSHAQKNAKLQQCRLLNVVTDCMDGGPRSHYADIALLAAETGNWPVFIHSYLGLMNGYGIDHDPDFEDDSPAETGFLQALASLHVDVLDLAAGMLLSSPDRPSNHYITFTGALSDEIHVLDKRKQLERRIESMINDEQLDLVNRVRIYHFYYWYLANDHVMTLKNEKRLMGLRKRLPDWQGGGI